MYFNKTQKESIKKKIKEVEQKSSSELVAVITNKSDKYQFVSLLISLMITVFISGLLITFTRYSFEYIFTLQVITTLFVYMLLSYKSKLLMILLPKKYKYEVASVYANTNFATLGLNSTQTKQAIMFFVSVEEKYVEIITDSNIKTKIPNEKWQDIVNIFIKDVKRDDIYNGYIKAISSCSEILIEQFPIQEDDINELSDELIELNDNI